MDFDAATRLLQLAVSPMVLISAVGLLLLSTTNRIARVIDRSRSVQEKILRTGKSATPADCRELQVLLRRCEILRWSIGLLVFSIIAAVIMILLLMFSRVFTQFGLHALVIGMLMLSVFSILLAEIFFLVDITLTLKALKIEVEATNQ
jgi:small-conductance mechanosensitive channel